MCRYTLYNCLTDIIKQRLFQPDQTILTVSIYSALNVDCEVIFQATRVLRYQIHVDMPSRSTACLRNDGKQIVTGFEETCSYEAPYDTRHHWPYNADKCPMCSVYK